MSKISGYDQDSNIDPQDKVIGTDKNDAKKTKNYTFADIMNFLEEQGFGAVNGDLSHKQNISDKVSSITGLEENEVKYPNTKAVADRVYAAIAESNDYTDSLLANKADLVSGKVPKAQSQPSSLSYNPVNGLMTFTDATGAVQAIDLPIENLFQSASYDSGTQILTLTTNGGSEVDIDLNDLVDLPEIVVATTNPVVVPSTGQKLYLRSDTGALWIAGAGVWNGPYLTVTTAEKTAWNAKADDTNVLHKTGNEIKTSGTLQINDALLLPALAATAGTTNILGIDDTGAVTNIPSLEPRIAVSNTNHTITDKGNQLIAFTSLTADRSLFMPPATTQNQRIRVVDESFTCNGSRRILIIANGSDTISGGINSVINFPGGSAYFESNGSGKWMTLSTTAIQLSAGVSTLPSITDNGNGTVTIGNNGVYTLFANTDGSGRPKSYSIAGGTYTMVDGSLNYIIAKYDPATSTTSLITSVFESDINCLSSIKVFVIYRQGVILFPRDNDRLGLALSNKLQKNAEQTNDIRVNDGTILLSESATRIVNVSAGTAWIGGNEIPLAAVSSSTANTMFFVFQTAPNVWNTSTFASGGQYSNTQYNNPTTGLQTLTNGRYAVVFVFRSLGQGNKLAYVLGQGDYTLGDAQIAKRPTNLPLVITSQMIPVGRIITLKNASSATQIDTITTENYAFGGVTDHEALSNLLGGDSSGHLHVTAAEKAAWNALVAGTLQSVYDNSAATEINTNSTLGAVTVQRGSAADTDNIHEGKNGVGTTTWSVDGNGKTTATSFVKTSGTASQSLQADGSVLLLMSGAYTPLAISFSSGITAATLITSTYTRVGTIVTGRISFTINANTTPGVKYVTTYLPFNKLTTDVLNIGHGDIAGAATRYSAGVSTTGVSQIDITWEQTESIGTGSAPCVCTFQYDTAS